MKTSFYGFPLIFSVLLFTACSSKLIVKSDPSEASVFVRPPNVETKTLVGKTPIELTATQLKELLKIDPSSGEYFELVVEKQNFRTERILIPSTNIGTISTTVLAKLQPGPVEGQVVTTLLQYLFNAQGFANNGEFERAQIEVDKALEINPQFVRAISMRATIYFLQHNYTESERWFEKALQIDPNYQDAVKMIAQIKKILGTSGSVDTRYPANNGALGAAAGGVKH